MSESSPLAPSIDTLVSLVVRVDPPLVELQAGLRARLDPADPRSAGLAQILGVLCKQHQPVYLEIDPATVNVRRLLIPQVVRVGALRAMEGGGFDVALIPSAARHLLRPSLPGFAAWHEQLREALRAGMPVIVAEDEGHNIVHVCAFTVGLHGPLPPLPPPGP